MGMSRGEIFLNKDNVGGVLCHPWAGGPVRKRKPAEQAMGNKLVRGIPPWLLLPFCPDLPQ